MNLATRIGKAEINVERLALDYISQRFGLNADELQAAGDLGAAVRTAGYEPGTTLGYLQDMAKVIKESDEEHTRLEKYIQHVHAIWANVGLTPEQVNQANMAVMMAVNPADVKTLDDLQLLDIRIGRELARLMQAGIDNAPAVTPETGDKPSAEPPAPVAQVSDPAPRATVEPVTPAEQLEPPADVPAADPVEQTAPEPPAHEKRNSRAKKPEPAPAPVERPHGLRQWAGDCWVYQDGYIEYPGQRR